MFTWDDIIYEVEFYEDAHGTEPVKDFLIQRKKW